MLPPQCIPAQHISRSCMSAALMLGLALALLGCQTPPSANAPTESAELPVNRSRPYYVRVQPEATSLISVNDDGENTFLEFGILAPGELKLFDADGKPLRAVFVRNLAILAGTHQGILLRLASATSFISLHPMADRMRKPPMQESPAIQELRDRLLQEGQRGAMERALAKANQLEQTQTVSAPVNTSAVNTSAVTSAVNTSAVKLELAKPISEAQVAENRLAREEMERSIEQIKIRQLPGSAPVRPMESDPGDGQWPRSQRIFFATNSVGITAPDDGLTRMLADARQSDEIWIAGHTDSTGARHVNAALAKRRAEAIKFILTSRGVPAEKIVIVRAPSDTYIAGNETDTGRAQNRRVELTFVRSRSLSAPRAEFGNPGAR